MIKINDFIEILKMKEDELFEFLKDNNPNAIVGENYILYLYDRKRPTIVSHIDTVHHEAPHHILWNDCLMWSPEGIGGDDRCGVYICESLWKQIGVNALFTNGEERGGTGAIEACDCKVLNDTPYFIELDRKGNDAVFYNDELLSRDKFVRVFVKTVKTFYPIGVGTFSDISILCEYFEVAGVNLGVGFHREHTFGEYINLKEMKNTMEKLPYLIEKIDKETKHKKVKHRTRYNVRYYSDYYKCWSCTSYNCNTCKYRYRWQDY